MNINTSTLLNTLMTKVDSTLKAKIEKLSVDGKIDLSVIVKDKGIQTLLSQLFKDIAVGTKNKTEVVSLLETSKHSLKYKNISSDIKQIISSIKSELVNTPKLDKLTTALSNSLLDIKNIDEKILKSSLQNNGIFLESKLAKSNESVFSNLKNMLTQLTDKLKILESIDKSSLSNNSSDLKSLKIQNSVNEIKNNIMLEKNLNMTSTTKNEIKQDVQNILKKIEIASQGNNKISEPLNTLKIVLSEIKVLEQKFQNIGIQNDITDNLKEVVKQVKNNILNNSFLSLNKTILFIKEQLENIKSNNITEVKTDIKKIEFKIETLNNEKNTETKINLVRELVQQTSKVIDKVSTANIQELLKNNISIIKNITGDVKTVILQIKESIELQNNNDKISQEFKNNVDKLLSQIDYYQLSSYASNSSHSYMAFLQDDLEDVDIKFNNKNNEEFSCLIHLSLKEKGDLKILLQLDKTNGLNINIGVEQQEFKMMIQDALQKLRVQINSLGLSILTLNIFDLNNNESKNSSELKAYGSNQNLDFGLDIKV